MQDPSKQVGEWLRHIHRIEETARTATATVAGVVEIAHASEQGELDPHAGVIQAGVEAARGAVSGLQSAFSALEQYVEGLIDAAPAVAQRGKAKATTDVVVDTQPITITTGPVATREGK